MMPTTRKRIPRHRRTLPHSPAALWRAGRYVEACARDPWVRFVFADHTMTRAEVVAAYAMRREAGWGTEPTPPDHAATMAGFVDRVTGGRQQKLAAQFAALGPLPPDADETAKLAMRYMLRPDRDDPAVAKEFIAAVEAAAKR